MPALIFTQVVTTQRYRLAEEQAFPQQKGEPDLHHHRHRCAAVLGLRDGC